MSKLFWLNFILPLLVPMAIAGLMVKFGTGPTTEDLLEDLENPDPDVREEALEWMGDVRRPSLLDQVHPHLFDSDEDIAEEALQAVRATASKRSLEPLDKAYTESVLPKEDVLWAIENVKFPQTLPYIEKHFDDPDPEVREVARKYARDVRMALNHEIVYYSLGNPIYNKMGYLIYSQALLFPEGREMVEGTPVEPKEGVATQ